MLVSFIRSTSYYQREAKEQRSYQEKRPSVDLLLVSIPFSLY